MKIVTFKLLFALLLLTGAFSYLNAALPAPTNLTSSQVTMGFAGGVKLTWEYDLKSFNARFSLYRKDGGINDPGEFKRIEMTSLLPLYIDYKVSAGKTYTYYVKAYNGTDTSEPSNKTEITLKNTEPEKGTISGTLLSDGTNKPVVKGRIQFIPATPSMTAYLITSTTDTLGKFTAKLNAGDYFVYAGAERFFGEYYDNAKSRDDAKKLTVKANETQTISISLTPWAPPVVYHIKGSVKNALGKPVKSTIQVFQLNKFTPGKAGCNILSGRTDDLGNYTVELKSSDTVVVFAQPNSKEYLPEYYNNKNTLQEADKLVITSDVSDINFVLDPKPALNNGISGQIKDTLGKGVTGSVAALRLKDEKARDIKLGSLTDSLGYYSLTNLVPGKYLLLAVPRPGYQPAYYRKDGKITYKKDEADTVVVTETSLLKDYNFTVRNFGKPKGSGFIIGKIRDMMGLPLNGALLFALNENGEMISYAMSNTTGEYEIDGLNLGTYSLSTDLFEYQANSQSFIDVNTSDAAPYVDITMSPLNITSVKEKVQLPNEYVLNQNYPNPFNPSTKISFSIPRDGFVTLKIYNILGSEIATLVNENRAAGTYTVTFNAADLQSGIYFYTLSSGKFTQTRKFVLLK